MNDIIISDENYLDLTSSLSEEIHPYSPSYPVVLLSKGIKLSLIHAGEFLAAVCNEVAKASPITSQLKDATRKGFRYVVDETEGVLKDIESGKIKLTTSKTGKVFAQIRDDNGRYGSKLPIKKEVFSKGIDSTQMANALQMKALQDQVQLIAQQIAVIDQSVREVIQGQQNDRIGLYYSGLALYLEASGINDNEMRRILIAQSLRSLSEARYQLGQTIQTDIKYLADGKYNVDKGKRVELIDQRIISINQSFAFIHQATMLRAGIYCNEGEFSAMTTVLNEYSNFIENVVAKNAVLLAQCDVTDTGTEKGIWKTRTKLKLDVTELSKQLSKKDKTIYLDIKEEKDK